MLKQMQRRRWLSLDRYFRLSQGNSKHLTVHHWRLQSNLLQNGHLRAEGEREGGDAKGGDGGDDDGDRAYENLDCLKCGGALKRNSRLKSKDKKRVSWKVLKFFFQLNTVIYAMLKSDSSSKRWTFKHFQSARKKILNMCATC